MVLNNLLDHYVKKSNMLYEFEYENRPSKERLAIMTLINDLSNPQPVLKEYATAVYYQHQQLRKHQASILKRYI